MISFWPVLLAPTSNTLSQAMQTSVSVELGKLHRSIVAALKNNSMPNFILPFGQKGSS